MGELRMEVPGGGERKEAIGNPGERWICPLGLQEAVSSGKTRLQILAEEDDDFLTSQGQGQTAPGTGSWSPVKAGTLGVLSILSYTPIKAATTATISSRSMQRRGGPSVAPQQDFCSVSLAMTVSCAPLCGGKARHGGCSESLWASTASIPFFWLLFAHPWW